MKRHPIVVFFVLGLVLSWACLIPLVLASHGKMELPLPAERLLILGAYGPFVAALVATLAAGGVDGLRHLLGRFVRWRAGLHWYVIAMVLPVVPLLLHLAFGGKPPLFLAMDPETGKVVATNPWAQVLPILYLQIVKSKAFADELAWRGFLLPRLQRNTNAALAAFGMAAAWCLFQSPLVFIKSAGSPLVAWLFLAVDLFSTSIIYTWIFNNTRGSLLPVVAFNLSFGACTLFLERAQARPELLTITLGAMAVIIIAVAGVKHLARNPASAAAAIADDPADARTQGT